MDTDGTLQRAAFKEFACNRTSENHLTSVVRPKRSTERAPERNEGKRALRARGVGVREAAQALCLPSINPSL